MLDNQSVRKYSLVLNTGASFSHIVGRMGKLESLDVKLFCAAAMDFYRTQVRRITHLFNCRIGKRLDIIIDRLHLLL